MSSPRVPRTRRPLVLLALAAAAAAPVVGQLSAPAEASSVRVLVSGTAGSLDTVQRAVEGAGGRVTRALPVIEGVAAEVPASAVPVLERTPGVRAVTPDATGHLAGVDPSLGYDVAGDEGSLYDVAQVTKAKDAWTKGWTGSGIDVALIDSGVAPVTGLTSGNVLDGPDLSFESQSALTHLDGFGHGTHMASIIVGRDQQAAGSTYAKSDTHKFNGIAPDARLVSIKVASNDGSADVSQVIAAIDWVTQHAQDPGMNIRVLNLSYGTDSTQAVVLDPLCYAVENAWRAGVVVVVSSGNDGATRQALADPAQDPLVIAVGADDTRDTDSVGDDVIAPFTQVGTDARHIDLIVPGLHVLGLRAPGSRIDQANPSAVVGNRFFRGTGTSQAAAVTSGLAAVYLSRYPTATPDQVKRVLMTTATAPSSTKATYGVGVPDLNKAIGMKPPAWTQGPTGATGLGTLEGARGSAHVTNGSVVLTGEQDIFGKAWDPTAWTTAAGHTWTGGSWNGSTWTGSTWTGSTWTGSTWTGTDWAGSTWTGSTWTGSTWTGHTWTDSGWAGGPWSGSVWTGSTWSTDQWR
jgi:serine protease AprX